MSEAIGPITVLPRPDDAAAGYLRSDTSPATLQLVDEEVRHLVDECYQHALDLLRQERPRLDRLAEAVLRAETLDEADAYAAAGLPRAGSGAGVAPISPDADKPAVPVAGRADGPGDDAPAEPGAQAPASPGGGQSPSSPSPVAPEPVRRSTS
jgi:cell division protease FtsH